MKSLALFLGLSLTGLLTSYAQQATTLTVTIENVRNNDGRILTSLHTADTFLKGPGYRNSMLEASEGLVTITFEDVPDGTYAVSSMHDVNGNFAMDYDGNGIPTEPYAMSGAIDKMGPPTFEQAKIEVSAKNRNINLRF